MTTELILDSGWDALVVEANDTRAYGGPASLRVREDAAEALFRFELPEVADGYVVEGAELQLFQDGDYSGSVELTVQRVERWVARKVTWETAPAVASGATATSVAKSGSTDRTRWDFDVLDDVLEWYADGGNWGWVVITDSSSNKRIHGFDAARERLRPKLVLTISEVPDYPIDLRPSGVGAISVTEPRLSWSAPDFEEKRIQVSSSEDFTSPLFDSGWLLDDSSEFDLSASSYTGSTSERFWRVNVRNGAGEGGWSQVASWTYAALPTVTITSPTAATVADFSPPVTWTAPGQESYRVLAYRVGKLRHDSGWTEGTESSYEPDVRYDVTTDARFVVRVRDGVEREELNGAPDYGEDSHDFEFEYTPGIDGPLWVTASVQDDDPVVTVTWDRTEAAEAWNIERDGKILQPYREPVSLEESIAGDVYQWRDYSCPPNREHAYRVLPMVNDETGDESPSASVYPEIDGVWLLDEGRGLSVVLDTSSHELTHTEQSSVYTGIGAMRAVKVTHGLQGLSGRITGFIDGIDGRDWQDQERDLWEMKSRPSRTYRLAMGDINIPVVLMNVSSVVSVETLRHDWRQQVSIEVLQQATEHEPNPWED